MKKKIFLLMLLLLILFSSSCLRFNYNSDDLYLGVYDGYIDVNVYDYDY